MVDIRIDDEWKNRVRSEIPELPDARRERYVGELGLPAYDAAVLTVSKETSDFFEAAVRAGADAKQASNWIMGELSAYLNANNVELHDIKLTPEALGKMIGLIQKGTISSKIAKDVFKELVENGGDPEKVVEEKGLVQISDEGELRGIVAEVVASNPKVIEDYKSGNKKAAGFFVGQIMKATKGKANPQMVNQLIAEELEKL